MSKPKAKVMIVEDEFIIIEDFKSILQQMEYDIVSTVTSGETALEQLTTMKPDLILMDMKLSGKMTGIETAKKVNELYDIPIIYITAYSDKKSYQKTKVTESYGFISKPVDEQELIATMEIAIHNHQLRKKFKTQYKNIPIPTYTWQFVGNDFILVDYNNEAEKINYGIQENLVGKTAKEVYKDYPSMIDDVTRCYNSKTNFKNEIEYKVKGTNEKKYFIVSYTFISPDIISVHKEDITNVKKMESELKISKDKSNTNKNNAEASSVNNEEEIFKGLPISTGVSIGNAYIINTFNARIGNITSYPLKDRDIVKEITRFNAALKKTREELIELEKTTLEEIGDAESKIFLAMNMILNDEDFKDKIIKGIKYNKQNAESVVKSVIDYYVYKFSTINNPYIRERSHDIEELGLKILTNLAKNKTDSNFQEIIHGKNFIIVASKLTPQITSTLNKEFMAGIIAEHGSYSSHAGILARGMGLPAVSGISGLIERININTEILIDGYEGIVIINPTEKTKTKYKEKMTQKTSNKKHNVIKENIVKTKDGKEVELLVNISGTKDLPIIENTNHNIGLYRTEFLFINSEEEPTEEEQFLYYKDIVEKLGKKRTITFRTLDIGDDKMPSYIPKEVCDNPALGLRGIRLTLYNEHLIRNQIKALLQVSTYGKIKIMFPMINSIKEVQEIKNIIAQEKAYLIEEKIPVSNDIEYGIMVETPAAVLSLEMFLGHLDFISVGTNDLIQYLLAADRNNENVSEYYDHQHPAVVRSLKLISNFSQKHNIPTSLCGELNTNLDFLPYLIGLGFRRLSINPVLINTLHKSISEIDTRECEKKLLSKYPFIKS